MGRLISYLDGLHVLLLLIVIKSTDHSLIAIGYFLNLVHSVEKLHLLDLSNNVFVQGLVHIIFCLFLEVVNLIYNPLYLFTVALLLSSLDCLLVIVRIRFSFLK